ncbi:MAG: hypothetical protein COA58_11240 [Bacteroidetes bacterium]|nr:MAG: hypothetical protein COA58_11240 [Bacteroidota bacterium]
MLQKLVGITLLCVLTFMVSGQEIEQCGHTDYVNYLETINPGISDNINETFFAALNQSRLKTKNTQDTTYTIQVVFHIVYGNQAENLPDEYITSQMRILNECFRRTNPDTVNTRNIFKPVAGDVGINFVLAEEDPNGESTNGILRVQTNLTSFGVFPNNLGVADRVKLEPSGSPSWDTEKYLNIWVCDLSASGFDALLGYAYPPTGAPFWNINSNTTAERQGVVIHYKVVGEENPNSLATGVKTLVHEVGHYLGLRHIWGDGGCGVDDFLEDTPRARRASNGCLPGINTCAEPTGEQFPDMVENYMDYSTGECQNMFTHDQIALMRTNLVTFRSGIYYRTVPPAPPVLVTTSETGVFPNPAIDRVLIQIADIDTSFQNYNMQIVNMLGQVVVETGLMNQSIQYMEGLGGLSGTYLYRIRQGDNVIKTSKILFGH